MKTSSNEIINILKKYILVDGIVLFGYSKNKKEFYIKSLEIWNEHGTSYDIIGISNDEFNESINKPLLDLNNIKRGYYFFEILFYNQNQAEDNGDYIPCLFEEKINLEFIGTISQCKKSEKTTNDNENNLPF